MTQPNPSALEALSQIELLTNAEQGSPNEKRFAIIRAALQPTSGEPVGYLVKSQLPDREYTAYTLAGDIETLRRHGAELIPLYTSPPDQSARIAELEAALKSAWFHAKHMAAWISDQPASYSFEGLGEDQELIEKALTTLEQDRLKST
ncbi:hypothetical protein [Asticcacaulis machinosus]|uniref:Uncharacterized protein n=1 Tax=Asticcacaulis machinosus TaxID=2984211 RepID=A0ABT5HGN5_9CAUL|nr:hypothetical protein [Asticcacaulis machinosus]MDC7675396.1 hypothetical protein [Asticcacaulis machinosus]